MEVKVMNVSEIDGNSGFVTSPQRSILNQELNGFDVKRGSEKSKIHKPLLIPLKLIPFKLHIVFQRSEKGE